MKKILKKSLACMLAAILCLTACVGAMASVSAEDAITYTIADVAINQGGSGTIDVTVGNFANVAGLIAEITLPDAVVSIDSVKLNGTAPLVKMTDDEPGHYVLNGKTIKFVGLFNSLDEFGLGNVDALTINIAVTVADEASETTFAAPVFQAGTELEQILAVNGTVGKLTVNAVCEHTETEIVEENRVEAKPGVAGSYDMVVRCKVCNAELSRTSNEIPALPEIVDCEGNHTYVSVKENVTATTFDSVTYCSACRIEIARYTIEIPQGAVLDENIAPSGHTTSVGETVGIGFRAKLSSLPTATKYKLYVVRHNNGGSYMFGTTSETLDQAGKNAPNDFLAFKTYYGIELYSFTVPVTYMVLCCDANDNVIAYSNPFTTTVEAICEDYHDLTSTGAAAKTLHADLINLAAATQKYFVSRNPNSDYAKKLVLPSFESAYASAEISGPLANYDDTDGVALTVTTAIGQNPYFNIRFNGNIANKANYTMKVSFYNKIKKDTIVTEIDGSTFKGNATTINGTFEALPLYAGDADVTIELYEKGNDKPIGVRHFSLDTHISTYLADNAGSTNTTTVLLMNIWDAAAKYGQAHRALRNIPYVPAA